MNTQCLARSSKYHSLRKIKGRLRNLCRRKRGEEVSPELDREVAQTTELHLSLSLKVHQK